MNNTTKLSPSNDVDRLGLLVDLQRKMQNLANVKARLTDGKQQVELYNAQMTELQDTKSRLNVERLELLQLLTTIQKNASIVDETIQKVERLKKDAEADCHEIQNVYEADREEVNDLRISLGLNTISPFQTTWNSRADKYLQARLQAATGAKSTPKPKKRKWDSD